MDLATYLSEQKSAKGMTLTGLAQAVGLSPSQLHDIKSGRRRAPLAVALKIEDATLGAVSVRDLAGRAAA